MDEGDADRPRRRTLSNGLLYFSRQASAGSVDADDAAAAAALLSPQARELGAWLQDRSQCDCAVQALLRGGLCDEALQVRFAGFVNDYELANPNEAKQMGKKIVDMFLAPSAQFKLRGVEHAKQPKSAGKDLPRLRDLLLGQLADSAPAMRLALGKSDE